MPCKFNGVRRRLESLRRNRFFGPSPNNVVRSFTDWTRQQPRAPQVIVSTCHNVHRNLAMEDWLYQKVDWSVRPPLLLLWRNSPCVVIGRHQNPWLECRLSSANEHGVLVARRNSGGGTVFHDLGNLNCTFFTSRSGYDRQVNLGLVCRALQNNDPNLDVRVSPRQDILLDDKYKISGTASKLGRNVAYHHCTVLFDVSTRLLSRVLRSNDIIGVESKSTRSIKSIVKNLRGVCWEDLVRTIRAQYLASHGVTEHSHIEVEPEERQFFGVNEIVDHYKSWEWTFGRCPTFRVERVIDLPKELSSQAGLSCITFGMSVKNGLIIDVRVEPDYWLGKSSRDVTGVLVGTRFPTLPPVLTPKSTDNFETNFLQLVISNIFDDFL